MELWLVSSLGQLIIFLSFISLGLMSECTKYMDFEGDKTCDEI